MTAPLLSLIIFIPLIAFAIVLFTPKSFEKAIKVTLLIAVVLQFILATFIFFTFNQQIAKKSIFMHDVHLKWVERVDWIDLDLGNFGALSIDYFVAVDGLSVGLIWLATLILLIGVIASWKVKRYGKAYFMLYSLLASAVVGCFVALDLFLFYLFFEFMLLPMYFLIGLWGGPRRKYAAIKFFLYTLIGSLLILIVIIGLYSSAYDPYETALRSDLNIVASHDEAAIIDTTNNLVQNNKISSENIVHSFDILLLMNPKNFMPDSVFSTINVRSLCGVPIRLLAFLALFLGFAIKLPVVPFHTWLPDAHVEAPTAISVVLAGVLLKVGGYGLIRIPFSIFPEGAIHYGWWIGLAGVITIIYAAMNAIAMKDIKKMIAYSSISHMGFVLLGLASLTVEGISGSIYQMFSHGIISAMLFIIAGILQERAQSRLINDYSGLSIKMPNFTAIVAIAFFAALGLPGFSGFIAEFLVLLGTYKASIDTVIGLIPMWMSVGATLGLLLGAAYFLWTFQKIFLGRFWLKKTSSNIVLYDLTKMEYVILIPLAIATLIFGLFPNVFLDVISEQVSYWTSFVIKTGQSNLDLIK